MNTLKIPEYSLFYHPVWKVLDEWGLPNELIDIIMKYKTFYSFTNITLKQLKFINIKDNYHKFNTIFNEIKNEFILNFYILKINNKESIVNSFFMTFIKKYNKLYFKDNKYILKLFLKFYNNYHEQYTNTRIKSYVWVKDYIHPIYITKFKCLLYYEYRKTIKSITRKSMYNTTPNFSYKDSIQNYKNKDELLNYNYDNKRFDIKYIWKNMTFLLKYYNYNIKNEDITKTDILMFNFMSGLNYKHDWDEKTLYRNLIKNEWSSTYIIDMFEKESDKYSMHKLYDLLYIRPFSSGKTPQDTFHKYVDCL